VLDPQLGVDAPEALAGVRGGLDVPDLLEAGTDRTWPIDPRDPTVRKLIGQRQVALSWPRNSPAAAPGEQRSPKDSSTPESLRESDHAMQNARLPASAP
jgi:hypothetical protein